MTVYPEHQRCPDTLWKRFSEFRTDYGPIINFTNKLVRDLVNEKCKQPYVNFTWRDFPSLDVPV